ncbi:e3 ubiquitin-protein ligase protein [Vespula maculifrons]|uniref:E3 ubiquitin-protein ligase protein n=1 Tax=Vespula maculifrons TaxID=7453 RepID=A0ABD2D3Q1_VESMC
MLSGGNGDDGGVFKDDLWGNLSDEYTFRINLIDQTTCHVILLLMLLVKHETKLCNLYRHPFGIKDSIIEEVENVISMEKMKKRGNNNNNNNDGKGTKNRQNEDKSKNDDMDKDKKNVVGRLIEDEESTNQGFGEWLRSNDGVEMMRLFVIANSLLLFVTMAWPNMKESFYIIRDYFMGEEEDY